MSDEHEPECDDCGTVPELRVTPYSDKGQFVVTCDCESRSIDVTECVSSNNLLEPIRGKWSPFDGDNPNR